jgi:hypothetical protein
MSTTSVKEIDCNRSINAGLNHVSAPWAHDVRIGRAVCCFDLGGDT